MHKAFSSVGHDEHRYGQNAVDRGLNLGFFCANTCHLQILNWQILFYPSPINMAPYVSTIAYKESTALDPFTRDNNPDDDSLISTCWQNEPLNHPENGSIGVMYDEKFQVSADIIIDRNAPKWTIGGSSAPKANTNTQLGKNELLEKNNYLQINNLQVSVEADYSHRTQKIKLKGLLGCEVDRMLGNAPSNTVLIAPSIYTYEDNTRYADMTVYKASSGTTMLRTDSVQLTWGLDDSNAILVRRYLVNPNSQLNYAQCYCAND